MTQAPAAVVRQQIVVQAPIEAAFEKMHHGDVLRSVVTF